MDVVPSGERFLDVLETIVQIHGKGPKKLVKKLGVHRARELSRAMSAVTAIVAMTGEVPAFANHNPILSGHGQSTLTHKEVLDATIVLEEVSRLVDLTPTSSDYSELTREEMAARGQRIVETASYILKKVDGDVSKFLQVVKLPINTKDLWGQSVGMFTATSNDDLFREHRDRIEMRCIEVTRGISLPDSAWTPGQSALTT
jgi:hypothetical protein